MLRGIDGVSIEELDTDLRIYDIDQKGWEQEGSGFEANVQHVSLHLTKDLVKKDFEDPDLVKTSMAPDSVQYGLRLARWAGVPPIEPIKYMERQLAWEILGYGPDTPLVIAKRAIVSANHLLTENLHDLGHKKSEEEARYKLKGTTITVASLLILSSELQSEAGEFSIIEAFYSRLHELRERFSIPQPEPREWLSSALRTHEAIIRFESRVGRADCMDYDPRGEVW